MDKRLLRLILGLSFLEISLYFLYLLFIIVMATTDGRSSLDVRPFNFSLIAFILLSFFAFLCFRPKK
jgi:hypothetical protein